MHFYTVSPGIIPSAPRSPGAQGDSGLKYRHPGPVYRPVNEPQAQNQKLKDVENKAKSTKEGAEIRDSVTGNAGDIA